MVDTRQKIIRLLSNDGKRYISGQDLSNKLNISRSAVWKHMNELKKEGYNIEGITNKGYRIIATPNKLSEHAIVSQLQTESIGRNIHLYDEVDSTQIIGHERARIGDPHGTVIIARKQTKGRGRLQRHWQSSSNQGLWFSTILRPDQLTPNQAPQLTLVAAVALASFLKKLNINAQIKWPNDIFVNGKKLAGILTEMQAEQDSIDYILLGIGLNVSQKIDDFNETIKDKATSLYLETNLIHNINDLYHHIFYHLEEKYNLFLNEGFSKIKTLWENQAYKMNEWITVKTKDTFKAKLIGIHEDGALIVEDEQQNEHICYSAEILW